MKPFTPRIWSTTPPPTASSSTRMWEYGIRSVGELLDEDDKLTENRETAP
jgi:hypothetical protein